jgi:hypothetical protein
MAPREAESSDVSCAYLLAVPDCSVRLALFMDW